MKLDTLPENSGVYIFKNSKNVPVYIGKANNIKKRVKNHFKRSDLSPIQRKLLNQTKEIETLKVDSEIEALVLEANLIKKYKPIFNRQLKDDKDYLYIKITNEDFPKVVSARKKDLEDAKIHFGPFPSSRKVRQTLKTIRKIFPYSNCKPDQKRPCLYVHIGLCSGVCTGLITKENYKKIINKIQLFLEGKTERLITVLDRERKAASKELNYEKAADMQSTIESIRYITKPFRFLDEEDTLATYDQEETRILGGTLNLTKEPKRIECYDISNLKGDLAVGSMVVFSNGKADKNEYRRFRIKTVKGINDVAMIREVIKRRFQNEWPHADLLIIDGGKPQLSAATSALNEMNINIPVVSLAKKFEEIFVPGKKTPIRLVRSDPALKLLQRVRDEAHRFAISYHKNLRRKNFLHESLNIKF